MAQGFARLYRRFWADERVRQLSPEEKLVAAYLLTGQSNRIGLFRFSVGMAEDDTGIPRKRLDTLLDRVCDTLRWGYDRGSGVVFIRSWWRWNAPESPLTMIGYLKDLADIPNTGLINEFRNNRDTLSDTLWHTLQDRVPESPSLSLSPSRSLSRAFPEPEKQSRAVARFVPPTLAEVQALETELRAAGRNPVTPERFIDFYESKGWIVGKTRMKSWPAAYRRSETWEQNGHTNGSAASKATVLLNLADSMEAKRGSS